MDNIIIPVDLIKSSPERLKAFLASDRYLKSDPITQMRYRIQLGLFDPNSQN